MAKAKTKSKVDLKQFMVKKGEYVGMGIAGFFLLLFLIWGVTKWSSAKDPDEVVIGAKHLRLPRFPISKGCATPAPT